MVMEQVKNIAFFHPDLGIGGAERLVIDAAVELQNRGHKVVIFTSRCDRRHCFEEVRDGTLDVRVRGDSVVPASIFSRFFIVCAILRQLHLIFSTYLTSELRKFKPNAFVVDQLSTGLPWLAYLYPDTKILFYCHFPDLLLVQGRNKLLKRVYRIPFDIFEKWSMNFADSVAVNSRFTKDIVGKAFPDIAKNKDIQIIYPCVNTRKKKKEKEKLAVNWTGKKILLSINRFERKKDIGLAIRAYAKLEKHVRLGARLVLAGGYDNQLNENIAYHKELVDLAISLGLKTVTTKTILTALNVPHDVDVLFLLSVSETLKEMLLNSARLLIYTPSNEHFGIVPLEAMIAGVPVLAANTGGPLETVDDSKTGWLCPPDDVRCWTNVMYNVLHKLSDQDIKNIGANGAERVKKEFCCTKMAERLDLTISKMSAISRRSTQEPFLFSLSVLIVFLDTLYYLSSRNRFLSNWLEILPVKPLTFTSLTLGFWVGQFIIIYYSN